jgi:hypothetical protein
MNGNKTQRPIAIRTVADLGPRNRLDAHCQLDGLRLSLMPASGRGIGLSVEMSITEALGLIEALPGRGGSGTASV